MKPAFEIHHPNDKLFDLPLDRFLLTFDDGYLDQYQYFSRFSQIDTPKIYFIVPIWLGNSGFMNLDQVLEIRENPNVTIAAHSYAHPDLRTVPLESKIQAIKRDTDLMISWFQKNLGDVPTKFCFPFNYRVHGIYERILRDLGFTEFYGDERIRPEQLPDPIWQKMNRLW